MKGIFSDLWFKNNTIKISRVSAIVFGIIWGIDGILKFQPGLVGAFPSMISSVALGQPSFLAGWFSFWLGVATTNSAFLVYLIGMFELALSFSLIFGFMRKVSYGGGFFLSLLIWAVPEGFGGPYGPGATDIGTGIIYAMAFLFLAVLSATHNSNLYTLDHKIEKRIKWWKLIAEIKY